MFVKETESPKKPNVSRGPRGVIVICVINVAGSHMKTTDVFYYFWSFSFSYNVKNLCYHKRFRTLTHITSNYWKQRERIQKFRNKRISSMCRYNTTMSRSNPISIFLFGYSVYRLLPFIITAFSSGMDIQKKNVCQLLLM